MTNTLGQTAQTAGGILSQTAGSILGKFLANSIIKGFSGNTTGRYPHPRFGPVIAGNNDGFPRFQITFPGFLALFGAALWAISKRGRSAMGQSEEREPEQMPLFKKLRRELRLKQEDVAQSDDPVEICLQRRHGWELDRLRELRESIAWKEQPGIFTREKTPLTRAETELLDDIEDCLDRIAKQYGSLEAAGLNLVECPLCGDEGDEEGDAQSD